jgi:hypothetical protein
MRRNAKRNTCTTLATSFESGSHRCCRGRYRVIALVSRELIFGGQSVAGVARRHGGSATVSPGSQSCGRAARFCAAGQSNCAIFEVLLREENHAR